MLEELNYTPRIASLATVMERVMAVFYMYLVTGLMATLGIILIET